jgi:PhnB protein
MIKAVHPYFNFGGNTLEAFEFYRSVFGGEFIGVVRYRDFPGEMGVGGEDLDRIANMGLALNADTMIMGTDVIEGMGPPLARGNNMYIYLETDSAEEADRVFHALSEGGDMEMPIARTEWAEQFGSFTDRFGVKWMVSYTGYVEFQPGTAG